MDFTWFLTYCLAVCSFANARGTYRDQNSGFNNSCEVATLTQLMSATRMDIDCIQAWVLALDSNAKKTLSERQSEDLLHLFCKFPDAALFLPFALLADLVKDGVIEVFDSFVAMQKELYLVNHETLPKFRVSKQYNPYEKMYAKLSENQKNALHKSISSFEKKCDFKSSDEKKLSRFEKFKERAEDCYVAIKNLF